MYVLYLGKQNEKREMKKHLNLSDVAQSDVTAACLIHSQGRSRIYAEFSLKNGEPRIHYTVSEHNEAAQGGYVFNETTDSLEKAVEWFNTCCQN